MQKNIPKTFVYNCKPEHAKNIQNSMHVYYARLFPIVHIGPISLKFNIWCHISDHCNLDLLFDIWTKKKKYMYKFKIHRSIFKIFEMFKKKSIKSVKSINFTPCTPCQQYEWKRDTKKHCVTRL